MNFNATYLVLFLIAAGGCGKATVDSDVPAAGNSRDAIQEQQNRDVAIHSGAFDARLEADELAAFWGPGAHISRMYADEAIAFEVDVDTGGRALTSRFLEQDPVEVDFFTGDAKSEDVERMRTYLKSRYPKAEWQPAIGHFAGVEEQWRVFPVADRSTD